MPSAIQPQDVILRDGATLRLRPPTSRDADALLRFFSQLSPRSLHGRFHGLPAVTPEFVEPFLASDREDHGSLVGVVQSDQDEQIVALAEFFRLRDPNAAEVAFAVADAFQRRGIGTRLLERLAALGNEMGISRFVAEVLPQNAAMLAVFRDAGFEVRRRTEGQWVELEFEIAPSQTYRTQVDMRDHVAVVASLRPFFEPASVAVLGASPRPGTIGNQVFTNIVAGGFPGAVYPVNRNGEDVAGVSGYRSVAEIPSPADLVVICLPGHLVVAAAEAALRSGTRALCVISAGFAEVGGEGEARQADLLALVRGHGGRLLGPNCLGLSVAGAQLNATFAPRAFPAGSIAFSSQSGALGLALLEQAEVRDLGFSAFVSVGNKADVSSNDLLEYWEEDPRTDVVLLYLESFGNPRKFGRLARRVARTKPILAMKSGATSAGARAASSHTAALAGSDAAVAALFRQAGVIRSSSLEELIDVAALLANEPLPRGRRVGILTNAGGLGILCADACDAAGLELPQLSEETRGALAQVLPPEASAANPVDILGSATAATYESVLPLLLDDSGIDAVIVLFVPAATVTAEEVAGSLDRSRERTAKPVLTVVMSAEGQKGSFPYPESAARALGRVADRADWLRRPAGSPPVLEDVDRHAGERVVAEALSREMDLWLRPAEIRRLLDAYGVPLVEERVAATPDEAAAAAEELGFPVAVKTAMEGVHKSELGGVALRLSDGHEVRAAAARMGAPVLVQPMITGGVELLAGIIQDPVFGPLVAFGPGGVFAELIGEARFRLAPLTDLDALELVREGKAGRLVAGYRGSEPADTRALADLVCRLARMAEDLPAVAELDLNPVFGLPSGCLAVDARVRVLRPGVDRTAKTW